MFCSPSTSIVSYDCIEHIHLARTDCYGTACSFPLTGQRCVSRIITDISVFDCTSEGLVLKELVEGVSIEELRSITDAPFEVASDFKAYQT
jgi:acyl CoA:acetate/3-ketoacid CoA transferase beta subunit